MPNATKLQNYTQLILDFLEVHQGKTFTQFEIIRELSGRIAEKGSYHLEYPLMSLVIDGRVNGRIQGIRVDRISWKDPSSTPTSAGSGEPMIPRAALERALEGFKGKLEIAEEAVKTARQVAEAAKAEAAAAAGRERIVKIVVERPKKPTQTFEETFHSKFEDILTLAKLRENIFLYGPMGSGKTFIGGQLARVLNLPFYFISCSQGISDSVLTGMLYPFGEMGRFEYAASEFLKAYEDGGVYLIDEIDRADPNLLIVINAALAGDKLAVPKRKDKPYAKKHPDFICIAAGNTLGNGADRMYSSATKLDASTMDRFGIGKILINYDENVERHLCPDDVVRGHLTLYRKAIDAHRLERAVSSRFMEKAYKLSQAGWSLGRIDEAFFLGWREDEVNKVKSFRC